MAEIRAVRNASSRRGQTSITHLLNFAAPSRAYRTGAGHASFRSHHHNSTVDKARFVHANYRFVVSPLGNYAAQATDADEYLDWGDVLQILASAESQNSSCPICLSEPVAPRMAKCGHIFCLPCLIRFMHAIDADESMGASARATRATAAATATANNHTSSIHGSIATNAANATTATPPPAVEKRAKWKKCPICEDSIYLAEARPVRFYSGQESPLPRPGDDVVLRLMMRHANSTVALPREGGGDVLNAAFTGSRGSEAATIPWHFAANVLDYARIMKGTSGYMGEQFDRELEDLDRQEKEDELLFHEDGEWTQRAMRVVRTAKEKARELGGLEVALRDSSKDGSGRGGATTPAGGAGVAPAVQDFFFYMSPPHLYLSPLDIRILKTKYGSFSSFPSTLLPRVEHLSTGHVVDDAMRRRAKYLGHLPAGCVVSFLECDWTEIVPAETLATFADDIERRRKRNRDKAAQEERERLQAERLEAAALHRGGSGGGRRNAGAGGSGVGDGFGSAADHGPVVDINDFLPLGSSAVDDQATSSSPPNPRLGFSQLASMSSSPPSSSSAATAAAAAAAATSPSGAYRTVWGTPAVPVSPSLQQQAVYNSSNVDDGWLKDDEVLGSLLDDTSTADQQLAAQVRALGVGDDGAGAPAETGSGAGRKKKKKQKITLMSTGGRRGN